MRVTRYTDYALRVLIYLAVVPTDRLSTIQEIADHYHISKNHLMKVVQQLNALGYVDAIRGKHGGLRLGRPADRINLGDLVRHTEHGDSSALVECFSTENQCVISPNCQLKRILAEALQQFLSSLSNYTLADIVTETERPALIQLLQLQS